MATAVDSDEELNRLRSSCIDQQAILYNTAVHGISMIMVHDAFKRTTCSVHVFCVERRRALLLVLPVSHYSCTDRKCSR